MKIHTKDLDYLRQHTATPIFAKCRELIADGVEDEYLEVWGPSIVSGEEILYTRTRIAWGAEMTVNQDTMSFMKYNLRKSLKPLRKG